MSLGSLESIVSAILGRDNSSEVVCIDKFLGDDAIKLLADKLECNRNKERLVLRGNCIGPTGAKSLAATLKESSQLTFLSLEWNQIGSDGAMYLAEALSFNTSLLHVDLRNNNIGDEGALELSKALEANDTLKTLDLRWNQIGDKGAMAFKQAILEKTPSVFVQLKGNPLSVSVNALADGWLHGREEMLALEDAGVMQNYSISVTEAERSNNLVHNAFQSAVLQKETAVLRSQCTKLQAGCADLNRQLDSSTLRVLQLEQLVLRHEFRASQLSDASKDSSSRLSLALDEHKALAATWEVERTELREEMKRGLKERDTDARILINEKGVLKDKIQKMEEELERNAVRFEEEMFKSDADREQAEQSHRDALETIASMTAQGKKFESEISTLTDKLKRSTQRCDTFEKNVTATAKENTLQYNATISNHEMEKKSFQEIISTLTSNALKKTESSSKEINMLMTKIAFLESEILKQKIESDEKYNIGVAEARELEKEKQHGTVEELKLRVQVFLSLRAENEARCDNYVKEIKVAQADHITQTNSLQTHIKSLEAEMQRQRDQCATLKSNLLISDSDLKTRTTQLEIVKKNLVLKEDIAETAQLQLAEVSSERQWLRDTSEALETRLKNVLNTRSSEFRTICENVTRAMNKELETLRVGMRIPESTEKEN